MGYIAAKCSQCGSSIEVDDSKKEGYCPNCGTKYYLEKIIKTDVNNIEKQINIFTGEDNFKKEKEQSEILITMLKNRDFEFLKQRALKVLDLNVDNKLAMAIYKADFRTEYFNDIGYSAYNFSEEPIMNYFKDNCGSIDSDLSLTFAQILIGKAIYSKKESECMKCILDNISALKLSKDLLFAFLSCVVLAFKAMDLKISSLEKVRKDNKSAAFTNILVTRSAALSTRLDLVSDQAEKMEDELKDIKQEIGNILRNYINETDLEKERKDELLKDVKTLSYSSGCYIATCVYGSYDCPEVWVLRRYRDNNLGSSCFGRLFIKIYYAVSPTIVKLFGNNKLFRKFWKKKLDIKVKKLKERGVLDTQYNDIDWKNKK